MGAIRADRRERETGRRSGVRGSGPGRRDSVRGGGRGMRTMRKKVCRFCGDRIQSVDFKNSELLQKFLSEKGKITPRRITGTCARHQKMLAGAIKRSRHSGLIPFQIV